MNIVIVAGCAILGAGVGAGIGGTLGVLTNTTHDDLGFGEGLSLLFGAGLGAICGAIGGAIGGAALAG